MITNVEPTQGRGSGGKGSVAETEKHLRAKSVGRRENIPPTVTVFTVECYHSGHTKFSKLRRLG